jgi:GT2 family glycosyltransferase
MSIAVIILTYNRVHLLEQCVQNVLARVSADTSEILIWDNGSTDGTSEYLKTLTAAKLTVVSNASNIGLNAYDPAIAMTTAEYIIGLDEDVVDAPLEWDRALMRGFDQLPEIGFLATNLVNNPHDVTSQIMFGKHAELYRIVDRGGVRVKEEGPVGGWCALTSRSLYSRIGTGTRHTSRSSRRSGLGQPF